MLIFMQRMSCTLMLTFAIFFLYMAHLTKRKQVCLLRYLHTTNNVSLYALVLKLCTHFKRCKNQKTPFRRTVSLDKRIEFGICHGFVQQCFTGTTQAFLNTQTSGMQAGEQQKNNPQNNGHKKKTQTAAIEGQPQTAQLRPSIALANKVCSIYGRKKGKKLRTY